MRRVNGQVTVPVSAGLLADTGAYFAALTSYRDGDAAPIVERFPEATVLAIANGRQIVTDLRDIRETWSDVRFRLTLVLSEQSTDMELSDVRGTVRSRTRSTRQTNETWHPRQDSNLQPTG
jgi:hypothetical protein